MSNTMLQGYCIVPTLSTLFLRNLPWLPGVYRMKSVYKLPHNLGQTSLSHLTSHYIPWHSLCLSQSASFFGQAHTFPSPSLCYSFLFKYAFPSLTVQTPPIEIPAQMLPLPCNLPQLFHWKSSFYLINTHSTEGI